MVLAEEINTNIKDNIHFLSNGIYTSIKNIVPMEIAFEKPVLQQLHHIEHGIMIETIGDLKGQLAIIGNHDAFNSIAQRMYGLALDGDMLDSFCCELTNMIGGAFATILDVSNIHMDISAPRIIKKDTIFSDTASAIQFRCILENGSLLSICYSLNEQ
ncbi:chemotaxis protein CheX [Sporosarcina sp. SAFN-015]|uniref:chemotaxis protein CheX n=1 Tax=Sporosarcina sp. SAFN-015 TaxID=3387274 RepID=UPI003F822103